MPRDANGNYTLPSGNPVQAGTTIESSWANPTMDDLAASITDSLDRNGRGGMLVPFQFVDGTEALPGITWASEPSTGFYRLSAGIMGATVLGEVKTQWGSNGFTVRASDAQFYFPALRNFNDEISGLWTFQKTTTFQDPVIGDNTLFRHWNDTTAAAATQEEWMNVNGTIGVRMIQDDAAVGFRLSPTSASAPTGADLSFLFATNAWGFEGKTSFGGDISLADLTVSSVAPAGADKTFNSWLNDEAQADGWVMNYISAGTHAMRFTPVLNGVADSAEAFGYDFATSFWEFFGAIRARSILRSDTRVQVKNNNPTPEYITQGIDVASLTEPPIAHYQQGDRWHQPIVP